MLRANVLRHPKIPRPHPSWGKDIPTACDYEWADPQGQVIIPRGIHEDLQGALSRVHPGLRLVFDRQEGFWAVARFKPFVLRFVDTEHLPAFSWTYRQPVLVTWIRESIDTPFDGGWMTDYRFVKPDEWVIRSIAKFEKGDYDYDNSDRANELIEAGLRASELRVADVRKVARETVRDMASAVDPFDETQWRRSVTVPEMPVARPKLEVVSR